MSSPQEKFQRGVEAIGTALQHLNPDKDTHDTLYMLLHGAATYAACYVLEHYYPEEITHEAKWEAIRTAIDKGDYKTALKDATSGLEELFHTQTICGMDPD